VREGNTQNKIQRQFITKDLTFQDTGSEYVRKVFGSCEVRMRQECKRTVKKENQA
jgi:hypothetical protein